MKTEGKSTKISFFSARTVAGESRFANDAALRFVQKASRQTIAGALMLAMVPLSMGDLFAQQGPPPPPPDQQYGDPNGGQYAPQQQYSAQGDQQYGQQYGGQQAYQPQPPQTLDQLVAPIALYPDSLVAQVLAASTYPAQLGSAEQFVRQYQGYPPEQLAQLANQQPWDPSVKALTAFPQVLDNLNRNLDWTTQLGNAYYNQPQDVMNAVQEMRQRAYDAGNLRSNQQLAVEYAPGDIVIQPVSPEVVYVPYYDPWVVYGAPLRPYGYYHYYGPPPGVVLGVGLAIGFGVGIAIGAFSHFGWGYHNWGPDWRSHTVLYNHTTYISNSVTVVNHGNYGAFDRNPQARAFNRDQAVRFANVNHTTINNVTVNRTNNNFNRGNGSNGTFNNPGNARLNNGNVQGTRPGQFNNGVRPGQPAQSGQFNGGARPGQLGQQPGQFNNGARPGQPAQSGQFNSGVRPGQPGQFNNGARPAQPGQFNSGARPNAAPQMNRPAPAQGGQNGYRGGQAAPPAGHAQPQRTSRPAPQEKHEGGGDHHK